MDSPAMIRPRLGELNARGLGDEGNGAARARIGLDDVEGVAHQGELHIDQAPHAHAIGKHLRAAANTRDLGVRQAHRRKHAGGVAGMDAGFLDVLHDAAQEELGAVVESIDIDLDGIVEESVDQQRPIRICPAGLSARTIPA